MKLSHLSSHTRAARPLGLAAALLGAWCAAHGADGAPAAAVPAAMAASAAPSPAATPAASPASSPMTMPAARAASSPAAARDKDVVLDAPARPRAAPPARESRSTLLNTPVHDAATAGALGELGLDLLRQSSRASGQAQHNAVVSPLSVAAVLGMAHAGAAGVTARELATVLGSASGGERVYAQRLPALLDRLTPAAGAPARPPSAAQPFTMANRVWLGQQVVAAVQAPYAALVTERFNADAGLVPFHEADAARRAINAWVSQHTAQRIPELMPAGSITPNTRVVLTNAVHFKSPWARAFDPAVTAPRPFHVQGGPPKMVPTMSDDRAVLTGVVDGVTVYELPFAGNAWSLIVGMVPEGHTLDGLETDLSGLDLAAWSGALKPMSCRFEIPRFSIAAGSRSLKEALQALGVQRAFTDAADFSPMLGKAGAGTYLDNVFHAATIVIDESGGEASAATGGAVTAKSFSLPPKTCAVDRPFVFAVLHKATGAPVFVGKVADPGA